MTVREIVGLLLVVVGVALAPFSHWLSRGWICVAVLLVCVGGALLFISHRARLMARRVTQSGSDEAPLPVLGEARGFAGHRAFDEVADD